MPARDDTEHPEDLPSNDVPADSDAPLGAFEPDPAEVVGDEGEEIDISHRPAGDPYHRDTLDERLAEEEPDVLTPRSNSAATALQAPDSDGDDVTVDRAEPERTDPGDADTPGAEEAAIHLLDPGSAR